MTGSPNYAALKGHRRIVLLTEGYSTHFLAKTAISVLRYRGDCIAAVLDGTVTAQDADGLFGVGGATPVVSTLDAVPDADAVYIGIAPPGGKLPEAWWGILIAAAERGLDLVSGLHDFLVDHPRVVQAAERGGGRLLDVRRNQLKVTGTGHRFSPGNMRVLTVGHDCSVGKMVTTLEIQRGLQSRGEDAAFVATGQTGIMVAGEGVPVDCVVADFVNGAVEQLVAGFESHDYTLIEGQGSIAHPAFSAVTAGLLHGAAPDGLVFCYEAGREQVKGLDGVPIAPLESQIAAVEQMARLRHPCRTIGISVNTRQLAEEDALREIERAEQRFGLPACDVFRQGADRLIQAVQSLRQERVREGASK